VREAVVAAIRSIGVGSSREAAACLLKAETDEDYLIREAAKEAVAHVGPRDKAIVPFIVADLKSKIHENGLLWRDAAWQLHPLFQFGADAAEASEIVGQLLAAQSQTVSNGYVDVQLYALLLAHIGPKAAPQRHYIVESLKWRKNLHARDTWSLYLALARTGCTVEDVPDLQAVLHDALEKHDTKLFVAASLVAGSLGEGARPFVPIIAEAVNQLPDSEYDDRYLGYSSENPTWDDDHHLSARILLLEVLGRLGPTAVSAVPVLTGFQTTSEDFYPSFHSFPHYSVRLHIAVLQTLSKVQPIPSP